MKRLATVKQALIGGLAMLSFTAATAGATTINVSPEGELGEARRAYYNIRVGDLRLAFRTGARLRWTDNVGYGDDDDSGWLFIPRLGLDMYYPLSTYVQISSGITAGYEYYLSGDGEAQFFVEGGEGDLQANITGAIRLDEDTTIQLRDQLGREIDSLDIAVRDRTEDYAAWVHNFSALYSKAINPKTTAKVQYTHSDRWTDDDDFEHLDYSRDAFDFVALYKLMRQLRIGPYARISQTRFHEDIRNDRMIYEGGVTATGQFQLGNSINYTVNLGYQSPDIGDDNNPDADDEEAGLVTNFNLSVLPGAFPGHRVRVGYRRNHTDPDPGVNYSDELFAGYGIDIRITKALMLRSDVDWVKISDSDDGEDAQVWRFSIRTGYKLTKHMKIGAEYRYTTKDSDMDDNEFAQNLVDLNVSYRF